MVAGGLAGCVAMSALKVIMSFVKPYFSPLRSLKGPTGAPFLHGQLSKIQSSGAQGGWHHHGFKKYGHVWVYKAYFNVRET
jgi:hypothetical protein